MQTLQYTPGQLATIFLETVDDTGARADGYMMPSVNRIILPSLSLDSTFPKNMIKLDTGLYYIQYTIPSGAVGVGSYLVDIMFTDPSTMVFKNIATQIVVLAPFGSYSAVVMA